MPGGLGQGVWTAGAGRRVEGWAAEAVVSARSGLRLSWGSWWLLLCLNRQWRRGEVSDSLSASWNWGIQSAQRQCRLLWPLRA